MEKRPGIMAMIPGRSTSIVRLGFDQFGGGVAGGVDGAGADGAGVLMSMSVLSPPPIPPPNTKYATTASRTSTTIAQTQLELPRSVPGVLEI